MGKMASSAPCSSTTVAGSLPYRWFIHSFALGFAPDSNILTGNDLVNGNWTYTY